MTDFPPFDQPRGDNQPGKALKVARLSLGWSLRDAEKTWDIGRRRLRRMEAGGEDVPWLLGIIVYKINTGRWPWEQR